VRLAICIALALSLAGVRSELGHAATDVASGDAAPAPVAALEAASASDEEAPAEVAPVAEAAPAAAAPASLAYANGRVTGRLDDVPAGEAIAALVSATGARLEGTIIDDQPIKATFRSESLEGTLTRILGEQNFTVRYGSGDTVKSITLLGGPAATPPPTLAPVAEAPVEPPPEPEKPSEGYGFPVELSRALERHRPLPLPDPLAEAMGIESATFPELLDAATLDENGVTRSMATQVVLSSLEMHGRLRRSFLRTLHGLDDQQFAAIVQAESGARFVEVVEYLTAHSREPSIQKKAGVILEQLKPPPPDPAAPPSEQPEPPPPAE